MKYDSKTWKAGHSGFLLASICFILYSNTNIIVCVVTNFIKFLCNSNKRRASIKKILSIYVSEHILLLVVLEAFDMHGYVKVKSYQQTDEQTSS